jgi:hypothetical protein
LIGAVDVYNTDEAKEIFSQLTVENQNYIMSILNALKYAQDSFLNKEKESTNQHMEVKVP